MRRSRPGIHLLHLAAAFVVAGCSAPASGPAPAAGGDAEAIRGVLTQSTERWNEGNLEGFVLPYDTAATFVGSRGLLRGKGAIREQYASTYFRTGSPTGALTFRDLEVRMLGRDHALVAGRYVVRDRRTGAESATGLFSLTMARRPEGWRIIHDHSS